MTPICNFFVEEDMKNFAVAKPVPIRRAVIHKQQILEVVSPAMCAVLIISKD